ncbi:PD-(D/E)XK nuclease family protein [Patescibacteria group bacterium]|nr:PD-(D/E)XK nuclease family protein [Patescibacteria group bacterium]
MAKKRVVKKTANAPIKHWSHSSLMAFLRNPLAWYTRYVKEIYDMPTTPAAVVGSAGHKALEYFYSGVPKELAIQKGLDHMRNVGDFEINFGKAVSARAKRERRKAMEEEYLRAISYYLARPPRHTVLGVEVVGVVKVKGLPIPIKAISDLVVESRVEKGAVDIVDHKFVTAFSKSGAAKSLFIIQAIFNYYTVRELYGRPVRRFIVYECKKTKNGDGKAQLRRYEIDFTKCAESFAVFHRLLHDATAEIMRERLYLPNPSDLFEGEHSFELYRLDLLDR